MYNFSYIYFSGKISEGVTMEKILDHIRDNVQRKRICGILKEILICTKVVSIHLTILV